MVIARRSGRHPSEGDRMNRLFQRLSLALVVAGLTSGCLPGSQGELGNGDFTYLCSGDADLTCADDLFGADLVPPAIAIGAPFEMEYNPDISLFGSSSPSAVRLDPAS